jgi:hypothetical protein
MKMINIILAAFLILGTSLSYADQNLQPAGTAPLPMGTAQRPNKKEALNYCKERAEKKQLGNETVEQCVKRLSGFEAKIE